MRNVVDSGLLREISAYRELSSQLWAEAQIKMPALYYAGQDGEAGTCACSNCCFLWRRDSTYLRTSMLL